MRSTDAPEQTELDYQTYTSLLDLWSRENPIKTAKLQVLLAVNAVLVAALNISGGITPGKWSLYLAGAVFCFIWTFSIGRTSLFQDVWQIKLKDLRERYPDDPRFSLLETSREKERVQLLLRIFGGIPSKWYLLFTPFCFTLAWLVVLILSLR